MPKAVSSWGGNLDMASFNSSDCLAKDTNKDSNTIISSAIEADQVMMDLR